MWLRKKRRGGEREREKWKHDNEKKKKKKKEEEEEEERKKKKHGEGKEKKMTLRDESYFKHRPRCAGHDMRERRGNGEEYLRDNGYFTATHARVIPKPRRKGNNNGNEAGKEENHSFDDDALHELEHELHEAIESDAPRRMGEVPELPPDGSHGVRFHRKNFSLWQHRADTVRVHVHGLKPRNWFL